MNLNKTILNIRDCPSKAQLKIVGRQFSDAVFSELKQKKFKRNGHSFEFKDLSYVGVNYVRNIGPNIVQKVLCSIEDFAFHFDVDLFEIDDDGDISEQLDEYTICITPGSRSSLETVIKNIKTICEQQHMRLLKRVGVPLDLAKQIVSDQFSVSTKTE